MGYEGYEQLLCENGHYSTADAYESIDQKTWQCEVCGARLAWWNAVDETNGSFDVDESGQETDVRIDGYVELEIDKPAVTETCTQCNHVKELQEETYKIPSDVGHKVVWKGDVYKGCCARGLAEHEEFGVGL